VQYEKRALQVCILVGSLVPITAGLLGVIKGPVMMGAQDGLAGLDGHFRYLSGILLAIGLAFVSTVRHIEAHAARFRVLTFLVVVGGFGRLLSLLAIGIPSRDMIFALTMELLVTPALALWQTRIGRRAASIA
jgi:uncharacterized membrane protein YfcA